jgi:hypothetical protein
MRRAVEKIITDPDIRAIVLLLSAVSDPVQAERYQEALAAHARTITRKRQAAARRAPPDPDSQIRPSPPGRGARGEGARSRAAAWLRLPFLRGTDR